MVATASLLGPAIGFSAVNLTALFKPSLSPGATIILPSDAHWGSQLQQRWSDYRAPAYFGAIKPVTEADVQNIVSRWPFLTVLTHSLMNIRSKFLNKTVFLFFATGGGHSFSDYSDFDGISIDLGNLNSTELNASTNTLTVGGSAKYYQLHDLLYNAGKELRKILVLTIASNMR